MTLTDLVKAIINTAKTEDQETAEYKVREAIVDYIYQFIDRK